MKHSNKNIIKSGILAIFIITMLAIGASKAKAEDADTCDNWRGIAESIMTQRQNDVPIAALIDVAEKQGKLRDLLVVIIAMAFNEPIQESKDYKIIAIDNFSSKVFMICYKGEADII